MAAVEWSLQGGVSEGLGKAGHLPQGQRQPGARPLDLLQCLICPLALPPQLRVGARLGDQRQGIEQKGAQLRDPQLPVLELARHGVGVGTSYQKWTGSWFQIPSPQACGEGLTGLWEQPS